MEKNTRALRRLAHLAGITGDSTAAHEAAAEQIALHRVDEARAVARPTNIGNTWVELEYDALRAEQLSLWEASGRDAAQQPEAEAFGLRLAADAEERMLRGHDAVLDAATQRYADTAAALSPFRRRPPGRKWLHYAAKGSLLTGDVVGFTMVGVNIGDYPILAFLLSISAAVATVIAGLVGAEVRDLRMAQRRRLDPGTLTAVQQPLRHLFTGEDDGKRIVKIVCGVSAAIALTIALSIFAGRAELEGTLIGLIYGGIAAAVASASLVESYMYADEVADHIDNASDGYEKELARHVRLAGSTVWRRRYEKIAQTEAIVSEHAARGDAAAHHLRALKWGVLRRNPGVTGHGPTASPTGPSTHTGGEQ
jgi:hypothetical protein